jgi:hypothetical protein
LVELPYILSSVEQAISCLSFLFNEQIMMDRRKLLVSASSVSVLAALGIIPLSGCSSSTSDSNLETDSDSEQETETESATTLFNPPYY